MFWSMCGVLGCTLCESFIGFQLWFLCSAFAKCSSSLLVALTKKKEVYVIALPDQYLKALIFLAVIIFCIPDPQGTWNTQVMTAFLCPKCFSGGGVPVTAWSAENKFTDVLMAKGWGTKEWWIRAPGHWQNNKVYSSGVLHNLIHAATNADPKKLYFSSVSFREFALLKCSSLHNREVETAPG